MSAYLLAKVRGKLARMLRAADLDTLSGVDMEGLRQRLSDTGYAAALEAEGAPLSDRLRQAFLDDVATLVHAMYGGDRTLIIDVLSHYRLENLKIIIRAQINRIPSDEVKRHLFSLAWEEVDYHHLLELPGLEAVIRELPWEEYRKRLEAVHQQVGDKRITFPYEARLDALYLQRLIHQYQSGPMSARRILKVNVLKQLLSWAFRLKAYGRSFPELVNILPDFRSVIPQDEMRHLVEDVEGWRGIGRLLGSELAQELEHADRFNLEVVEGLFSRRLMEKIQEAFVTSPFGMGVAIGYVYLKELELERLIEIMERAQGTHPGGSRVYN